MLQKFKIFLEMIKFEHSIFALPFAYLGLFLGAKGFPSLRVFFWVTTAMVSFRTLGMGLNRLIDHSIDARNPRTTQRALPSQKLTRQYVWIWAFMSFLIFEGSAYALGPLCFALTPIPVFLAVLYPFMKRFSWLSHFVLGSILGIAPYGAWLAAYPHFSWIPGLITLGVLFWVAGFDMIYALQDESFDRSSGLYSVPAKFGKDPSLLLTRLLHLLTMILWSAAGWLYGLGWIYFAGLFLAAVFLIREHWLVQSFGLEKIEEAFLKMNAVVSIALFVAAFLNLTWMRIS